MNIFVIPSWYPSATDQTIGIFVKEQHEAYARNFPNDNVGIVHWGQNNDRLKFWVFKPTRNIVNWLRSKPKPTEFKSIPNHTTYFRPVYTWTRKWLNGNKSSIVSEVEFAIQKFENQYGKADIIHAHVGYPGGMVANAIASKKQIPYLITENMSPFPFIGFLKGDRLIPQLQAAYDQSEANIAVSKSMKKLMETHKIPKVVVLPNFVDENKFVYKKQPIVNKDGVQFFFLGRMVSQKGVDVLIHALTKIKKESKVRFSLSGTGAELSAYQHLARQLKVDHFIRWRELLSRGKIIQAYQGCDVFILPSRHEGLPVSAIEAMACGKPILTTRCGGPEELVPDKVGIVVVPESSEDLAMAIKKMIETYQQYDSQIIRQHFMNHFSSQAVCKQYRKLYQEVIPKLSDSLKR